MVTAVEFERRVTRAGVLRIVVRRSWPLVLPVVLLEVDKGTGVGFHRGVLSGRRFESGRRWRLFA